MLTDALMPEVDQVWSTIGAGGISIPHSLETVRDWVFPFIKSLGHTGRRSHGC